MSKLIETIRSAVSEVNAAVKEHPGVAVVTAAIIVTAIVRHFKSRK